jgi:AmmeMemoRadiSam system protein B
MADPRPRLRALDAFVERRRGEAVLALRDPEGLFDGVLLASPALAALLPLLDGTREPAQVAAAWTERTGLPLLPADLEKVLADLRERLVLEGPAADAARAKALATWRALPARPAACAGSSYPEEPDACRDSLSRHEADAGDVPVPASVRAVLAPHIDLRGGGPCHGAAGRAYRRCDADVFVVIGTAHAALRRPFALTRHGFDTPLGRVETDRGLVERLSRRGGGGLLDDETAHRAEHSVEFQALWLAHVRAGAKPPRIVPVLAGSIGESIRRGRPPEERPEVADFVAALRELAREGGERVALVASVDFAHVGPRYGGDGPVKDGDLAAVLAADRPLLDAAARCDARGWFEALAAEGDRRSVCGASPTWTLLAALAGSGLSGTLLRHDEWEIDPETGSHVSFAAMAFAPANGKKAR